MSNNAKFEGFGSCILFDVDKNGKRLRTVFPGNLTDQYQSFDTDGKITEVKGTGQAAGVGTTFYDYTFTYTIGTTKTAHIVTRIDSANASRREDTYTDVGQLFTEKKYNTAAPTGGTLTQQSLYCYDANGNRTSESASLTLTTCPGGTTHTYDGANQTLGAGSSFDTSGDETSMPTAIPTTGTTRTATWSDSQQLASTTVTGATALANTYFGGGNQNLIATGVSATDQDQIRDAPLGASQVTRLVSGAETARMYTERDPTGHILVLRSTTGSRYDILTNNLASVIRVTADTTGNLVDSYGYDPYGARTITTNGFDQPFGYTSAYTNPATGLIHLQARYYDPTTARFTQPDPMAHLNDPSQASPYPYAGNDPINNTDPSGRNDGLASVAEAAAGVGGLEGGGAILEGITETGAAAAAGEEVGAAAPILAVAGPVVAVAAIGVGIGLIACAIFC